MPLARRPPHEVAQGRGGQCRRTNGRPGLGELGRERRTATRDARRVRGQHVGRPKALDTDKVALARRMHAAGEPVMPIAATLGV